MVRTVSNTRERSEVDGAVIYDGDGDGTSAAAMWIMTNPGEYLAFTNTQKGDRDLVRNLFSAEGWEDFKRVGIFDVSAEQNLDGLERLSSSGISTEFYDHHTDIDLPTGVRDFSKKGRKNCEGD